MVFIFREPQLIQAALYQVFAGARFLNDSSADRIRPVLNFAIHPNFTHTSHLNDIAVIRVSLKEIPNNKSKAYNIDFVEFIYLFFVYLYIF